MDSKFNNTDYETDYKNQTIEQTRKNKIDEFKRSFDKSTLIDDVVDGESYFNAGSNYDLDNFDDSKVTRSTRRQAEEINSFSDQSTRKKIERDSKKALKQQQKDDKRIEKAKAKGNKRFYRLVWLSLVILLGIVLGSFLVIGVNDMLAINRSDEPVMVTVKVPANPDVDTVAEILDSKGVINEPFFFKLYAQMTNSTDYFRQGDFQIKTGKDYEAIINSLQSNSNRTDIVTVQITEGMSVLEIAQKLYDEGITSDIDEFLKLCNSDEFDEDFEFLKNITNKGDRYYKLEGYLFPDTYDFYKNEDPDMTISRFLNNFEDKVFYTKKKASGYSKNVTIETQINDSDYSLDEIITIASIIQAEAANIDDMYNVSSVLHNRLEADVDLGVSKLNCDCTVYYPYRDKDAVPSDMKATFSSKYNTYEIMGLTPGAVCNPGYYAIQAALNPNYTSYYYFCHSEDGDAYYASTSYEHEYNLELAGLTE